MMSHPISDKLGQGAGPENRVMKSKRMQAPINQTSLYLPIRPAMLKLAISASVLVVITTMERKDKC